MKPSKFFVLGTLVASLVMMAATPAGAASDPSYDMTTDGAGAVPEALINGAYWTILPSSDPTGSGVFNAFFRVQANSTEQGYNTDGRPLQFDELKSATFTHSALFEDVPLVEYPADSGEFYYEFQLDLNESKNTPYMSLDKFEVYTTNDQYILGYPFEPGDGGNGSGEAELVYALDGDGDTYILMDYRWNTGSGKRDYRVLVPDDYFVGKELMYVVIFTGHGDNASTDDGFEEWGVAIYPTAPNTMVAVSTSAAADVVIAGETVDLTVTETNTGNAPLTNISVVVNDGTTDIATLDASTAIESGTDNDILDVGETWTWNASTDAELNDIVISDQTTFTVTGYGEDEGTPITYPDYPDEQASITIYTLSTMVGISSSAEVVGIEQTVDLTVTEENDGDLDLTNVSVVVNDGTTDIATLDASTAIESMTDDDILEAGETWTWNATTDTELDDVVITTATNFRARGSGDWDGITVDYTNDTDEETSVTVSTLSTDIDISSSSELVDSGDSVDLTVTEENDGDLALTNVSVVVTYDSTTLVTLDATTAIESMTDDDILEVGETWTWDATTNAELDDFTVTDATTFTAIGSADYDGVTVTWCEDPGSPPVETICDQDEKDEVTVNVEYEPCIVITKSVSCDTSKVGDTVTYTICIENCGPTDVYFDLEGGITDNILGDISGYFLDCDDIIPVEGFEISILPVVGAIIPAGMEECCVDIDYEIQPEDDTGEVGAILSNQVTFTGIDEYENPVDELSNVVEVLLVHPELVATKSCTNPDQIVEPGGVAMFQIGLENTGDVCLYVEIVDIQVPGLVCGPFTLEPGDFETCDVEIDVPPDTTATEILNQIEATWTICVPPRSEEPPCLLNEGTVLAEDSCRIPGGATRTPGFWKTHYNYTAHILADNIPGCGDIDSDGCINLGWIKVCTMDEVCAVFWANKTKNSDGSKRSKLCQARMHASFHALAAIFNNCMPSGAPIPVDPADIAAILGGTKVKDIKDLASILAAYNESGDDIAIIDPWGPPGSATPSECKSVDMSLADCP